MALKKKFVEVEVPIINTTLEVLESDDIDKRTIKLDLSRKMKGKGIEVTFSIFKNENHLVALPKRIILLKAYIRRMMRKRTNYVEDSFTANAKDVEVIIKPFLITRKKVSRAVRKNLRNTAKEFLLEYVKEKTFIELCDEILSGTLQREMIPKLKKVYPLSFNDLRVFETSQMDKIDFKAALEKGSMKKEKKSQAEEITEELAKARELVKKKQEEKAKEEKKEKAKEIKEEKEAEAKETQRKGELGHIAQESLQDKNLGLPKEEAKEDDSEEKKEKKTKKTSKPKAKEE